MKKHLVLLAVPCLVLLTTLPVRAADTADAAYFFAMARLASSEGSYGEALEAFEEALRLAPKDGYVRVEMAALLARLGRFTVSPGQRNERFSRAAKLAKEAAELAVGDFDLLAEVGNVYMNFADQDEAWAAQAIQAFEAARTLRPEEPQVLLPLGQLYLSSDRFGDSVEALRRVRRAIPGNRMAESLFNEALGYLVTERMRQGRSREAEELLAEVLSLEPQSTQARISLADLQAQRGDHAAAAETLRQGLSPETPELRQRLAYELYQAGDFQQASEEIDQLLAGDFPAAGGLKILLLAVLGRNEEALDGLTSGPQEATERLAMAATVARLLDRDGFHGEAVRLLTGLIDRLLVAKDEVGARTISLEVAQLYAGQEEWQELVDFLGPNLGDPDADLAAPFRLLYAEALTQLGRDTEALGILSEQEDGRFLAKRAETLIRMGRAEEGEALLERLGEEPEGAMQAALVYQRLERYTEAVGILEKLVAKDGASVEAQYFLGSALERAGQIDRAVEVFEALLKASPDFAPALNYLGYMWAERSEKLDRALRMINKAVAIDPDNGAFIDSLGWVHFQRGELESARDYLERAARLISDDPTVFEHLGDVYSAMGDADRAGESYRRAIALSDASASESTEHLNKKIAALEAEHSAQE